MLLYASNRVPSLHWLGSKSTHTHTLSLFLRRAASGNLSSENFHVRRLGAHRPNGLPIVVQYTNTVRPHTIYSCIYLYMYICGCVLITRSTVFKLYFKLGTRSLIQLHTAHLVRQANRRFTLHLESVNSPKRTQDDRRRPISLLLVKNHFKLSISPNHHICCFAQTFSQPHPLCVQSLSDNFIVFHVHR